MKRYIQPQVTEQPIVPMMQIALVSIEGTLGYGGASSPGMDPQ